MHQTLLGTPSALLFYLLVFSVSHHTLGLYLRFLNFSNSSYPTQVGQLIKMKVNHMAYIGTHLAAKVHFHRNSQIFKDKHSYNKQLWII